MGQRDGFAISPSTEGLVWGVAAVMRFTINVSGGYPALFLKIVSPHARLEHPHASFWKMPCIQFTDLSVEAQYPMTRQSFLAPAVLFCAMLCVLVGAMAFFLGPQDISSLSMVLPVEVTNSFGESTLPTQVHNPEDVALLQRMSQMILQRRCPTNAHLEFVFPHVPKAGGRSLEMTFNAVDVLRTDVRYRYISLEPRSRTHNFTLKTAHRNFAQLARDLRCDSLTCEATSETFCRRWMYAIREPVSRFISAFYTSTGRSDGGHFVCAVNSTARRNIAADPDLSIEDWARLPREERDKCRGVFNVYVNFLAPELRDDPKRQFVLAKQRLTSVLSWTFIMDELAESFELFSYIFGSDLVHHVPAFNYNKYEKKLSARAQKVIEEHNLYDIELYKHALKHHRIMVDLMRADSSDPFYNKTPFRCDKDVVCWDKLDRRGSTWDVTQAADWEKHFPSKEQAKMRQLCAPRRGCWREDLADSKFT
ncbi:Hypothetical Protein FCC1311_069402 [Hondaea fermentalgiana]|uniref:Ig-like domain-containing protein n=1 Tax=Hondaea fermentalgiana TaxID=2315210 RepID=A0A2R5GIK2_9STRA|nr:Hypothetical Protein FCC1311_069402 [Hondaea fermentalgiana]|eukprot:GBG30720.1 Hypothetical Protein FCC1311_069402 [Hondaea fermentalgiana]